MASQGSASSGSRSRSMGSMPVVKFYHDERSCGFFKWADLTNNINKLQLLLFEKDVEISSLVYEKEELERNVKMLKEREAQLEEQVVELAIENTETLIAIKSAKMDKKFVVALVLSWVFFWLLLI
ncbi:V-type ATP synthase subunit I [Bienertia sinuspersici]